MNELLLRRRAHSESESYTADDYIQNGLVLQLDGPDYDAVNGTWTDRKGSRVFTKAGSVSVDGKGVYCNKGRLECTNALSLAHNAGTIEVVAYRKVVNTNEYIYMQNAINSLIYGTKGVYAYISNYTNNKRAYLGDEKKIGKFVHSINDSVNYYNGSNLGFDGTGNAARGGAAISVGGLPNGSYYFCGTIYSIRVYNRKLTAEEMLFNQHIDNVRFSLGLTI